MRIDFALVDTSTSPCMSCMFMLLLQVDQGTLDRLREAASSKSARLESQRLRLQEVQTHLDDVQDELGALQQQLAAKKKEATEAQADYRKTRYVDLSCDLHARFVSVLNSPFTYLLTMACLLMPGICCRTCNQPVGKL